MTWQVMGPPRSARDTGRMHNPPTVGPLLQDPVLTAAHAGELLRVARHGRGWSQLDLALEIAVSQRHVSFVEAGRSRPSRELILAWTAATGAPASLRDAALRLAGLAPDPRIARQAEAVAWFDEPLKRLLATESTMPLVLFDDDWILSGFNAAGEWLSAMLLDEYGRKHGACAAGLDMLHAVSDDDGLLRLALNGAEAAASLLEQLRQETWLRPSLAGRVDALRQAAVRRYGRELDRHFDPAAPRRFVFGTPLGRLAFYPMQGRHAPTADDTPAIRMEQWVPADEATAAVMRQNLGEPASAAEP